MSEKSTSKPKTFITSITEATTKAVPPIIAAYGTIQGSLPEPADKLMAPIAAGLTHQFGELAVKPFEEAIKKVQETDAPITHFDEKIISLLGDEKFVYLTRLLLRMAPALAIVAFQQPESLHLIEAIVQTTQGLPVESYQTILQELATPLNLMATTALTLSGTTQLLAHSVNIRRTITDIQSLTKH